MQKLIALLVLYSIQSVMYAQQLRIQNGKNAVNGQFPYHAHIATNRDNFCGGSIIHNRWILTAAHCAPIFVGNYRVIIGSVRRNSGRRYEVDRLIEHPDFSECTLLHDIALIRLKRRIRFGRRINKVNLPKNSEMYDNALAVITGFGITNINGYTPKTLQYIDTPIVEQEICKQKWDYILLDSHICTSIQGGKSACAGDSGGPVVVNNTLVGIVSFGDDYCSEERPCVHTRVSTYVQWIEEVLASYSDSLNN